MSIIIGNLLDNAIEACLNPSVNDPFIELNILTKVNYLIVEILNSKSNAVNTEPESLGNGFTTKNDKENHGLGIGNIKRIVKQYEGLIKIEDRKNTFLVHMALPLE